MSSKLWVSKIYGGLSNSTKLWGTVSVNGGTSNFQDYGGFQSMVLGPFMGVTTKLEAMYQSWNNITIIKHTITVNRCIILYL